MKIKTNELIGAALDWAVNEAVVAQTDEDNAFMCEGQLVIFQADSDGGNVLYAPSTDWSQGGPIIEREQICLDSTEFLFDHDTGECIELDTPEWFASIAAFTGRDPTPLIAAMRCYVASKLGDEVEVPDWLANPTK